MDLLSTPMPIDLHDKKWRIYARNPGMAPHYIAKGATVNDSLITEGCEVYGTGGPFRIVRRCNRGGRR